MLRLAVKELAAGEGQKTQQHSVCQHKDTRRKSQENHGDRR